MQVTKLRAANDNGLVPAGRYFARLAADLRQVNERAAAIVDVYEAQERRPAVKRGDTVPAANAPLEHAAFGMH